AWAEEQLGVPVIDHWWQTETGWPIGANCLGIERVPVKHGSCTRAVPSWDVRVLDAEAEGKVRELAPGEIGALAVKLPLPPGALPTLWQADDKFVAAYLSAFPGSAPHPTSRASPSKSTGFQSRLIDLAA